MNISTKSNTNTPKPAILELLTGLIQTNNKLYLSHNGTTIYQTEQYYQIQVDTAQLHLEVFIDKSTGEMFESVSRLDIMNKIKNKVETALNPQAPGIQEKTKLAMQEALDPISSAPKGLVRCAKSTEELIETLLKVV